MDRKTQLNLGYALARPVWLLVTLLLPEQQTSAALPELIMGQVRDACRDLGIAVIGGHTEITTGLHRPIADRHDLSSFAG